MSFGQTANHISAVIIPIVGGIIWDTFGYRNTFLLGAAFVFADMCFAFFIDPGKQKLTEVPSPATQPERDI
jgi:MFS family permease